MVIRSEEETENRIIQAMKEMFEKHKKPVNMRWILNIISHYKSLGKDSFGVPILERLDPDVFPYDEIDFGLSLPEIETQIKKKLQSGGFKTRKESEELEDMEKKYLEGFFSSTTNETINALNTIRNKWGIKTVELERMFSSILEEVPKEKREFIIKSLQSSGLLTPENIQLIKEEYEKKLDEKRQEIRKLEEEIKRIQETWYQEG